MGVGVVIPSRNEKNLTVCVERILELNPGAYIRVVDDGIRVSDSRCVQAVNQVIMLSGKKPFAFPVNVNIGFEDVLEYDRTHPQGYEPAAVIVMNDDAVLQTEFGLDALCLAMQSEPKYGVISAGIVGSTCNPLTSTRMLPTTKMLAEDAVVVDAGLMVPFICVAIRFSLLKTVGLLDEQFIDYGFDDDDYCRRVRGANYKIGVLHSVRVEHGHLPSTYRSQACSLEPNRKRYLQKWGNHEGWQR